MEQIHSEMMIGMSRESLKTKVWFLKLYIRFLIENDYSDKTARNVMRAMNELCL